MFSGLGGVCMYVYIYIYTYYTISHHIISHFIIHIVQQIQGLNIWDYHERAGGVP